MISLIRPATPDEVKSISERSDLTPESSILALPNGDKPSDLAVMRRCLEIDPIWFSEGTSAQRKYLFGWGLFLIAKAQGFNEVYCNVDFDAPSEWLQTLEKLGAQKTTDKPQLRYKINLG